MSTESCPLPASPGDDEAQIIGRLLQCQRIAIVGLSDNPQRPSYGIGEYLLRAGKQIIPINPNHQAVLGLPCYPSLQAAPGPIELVDVFRRSEFCPDVVRDAIAVGAKGVWLQSGITSDDARRLATGAGIDFVQDRCIMVEHLRLARRV